MAERYEVKETEGFYITDLEEGLGADLAGLRPNDIIKSVDNITINKFADLSGYLASKRPGENVNIVYNRNGEENEVKVRLEKINRANFFLMEVRELTPDQKKKYQTQQGLYISNMNNRWLYQRGVDNGYIILEINNREVNKLKEVRNLKVNDIESILFLKPSGEKERISLRY
jgi:S1-C subfamily serine protease